MATNTGESQSTTGKMARSQAESLGQSSKDPTLSGKSEDSVVGKACPNKVALVKKALPCRVRQHVRFDNNGRVMSRDTTEVQPLTWRPVDKLTQTSQTGAPENSQASRESVDVNNNELASSGPRTVVTMGFFAFATQRTRPLHFLPTHNRRHVRYESDGEGVQSEECVEVDTLLGICKLEGEGQSSGDNEMQELAKQNSPLNTHEKELQSDQDLFSDNEPDNEPDEPDSQDLHRSDDDDGDVSSDGKPQHVRRLDFDESHSDIDMEDTDNDSDYRPDDSEGDGSSEESEEETEGVGVGDEPGTDDGDGDQAQGPTVTKKGARDVNRLIISGRRGGLASKGKARVRAQVTDGGKKRRECPVEGCPAEVCKLRRHLIQCHGAEFSDADIKKLVRMRPEKGPTAVAGEVEETQGDIVPSGKQLCPLCRKPFNRLDRHLKRTHGLSGDEYKRARQSAKELPAVAGNPNTLAGRPYKEQLLKDFETWLRSMGGLNAPAASSAATCNQVSRILDQMVIESGDLVLQPKTLNNLMQIGDRGNVMDKLKEKYGFSLGTTANYAYAAAKFVDFLHQTEQHLRPWIETNDFLRIRAYVHRIKSNLSKVRRSTAPEDRPRTVTEEDIPLYDQIAQWRQSNIYRKVREIATLKREYDPSSYDYLLGFIVLEICLSNGRRAGDLCNLTLGEFGSGRMASKGRTYVLSVKEHKVQSKNCLIVLQPYMRLALHNYIQNVRPDANSDKVFVSANGKPLSQSELVRYLNVCWTEFGKETGQQVPWLTTTKIRKTIVTYHRQGGADTQEEEDLALLMTHNKSTADTYYDLHKGRERASDMSIAIDSMWGSTAGAADRGRERAGASSSKSRLASSSEEEDSSHETRHSDAAESELESSYSDEDMVPPSPRGTPSLPATNLAHAEEEEMEVEQTPQATLLSPLKKPKKEWNRRFQGDDEAALLTVFKDFIQDRVDDPKLRTTEKEIDRQLKAEPRFLPVLGKFTIKDLANRLRYEIKKAKAKKARMEDALAAGALV